ncbi:hypothetical protein [Microcella sp.]|uniref:hypothetical protein n=1 Tax=Microcella sp. TaxID=1913979 RepID=UPI00391BB944
MKNPSEPTGRPAFDAESMNPRRWMRIAAWRKRALAHEYYRGLDDAAREGISDEDYATTMATLERMARNLGWNESQGMPGGSPGHGRWPGRGHHRGHHGHHGHHGRCGERHSDRETVEA